MLRKIDARRYWTLAAALRVALVTIPLLITLPATLGLANYEPITRFEQRIYDYRLRLFGREARRDERIVIVDIDEASLRQYGRWPWHRDTVAKLSAELLQRQQVALLGFDILFSEPDVDNRDSVASVWSREMMSAKSTVGHSYSKINHAFIQPDVRLAESLRGQPVVLGYYFSSNATSGQTGSLSKPLDIQDADKIEISGLPYIAGYSANLPLLVEAVPAGGFMNALTDSDGALRSVPLVAQQEMGKIKQYYPALSLAMFMAVLKNAEVRLLLSQKNVVRSAELPYLNGLELRQGDHSLRIPTDIHGAILVPFTNRKNYAQDRFRYVSAAEVLNGKLGNAELRGQIVFIGSTAPGLRDLHITPVSVNYPGVEVHATLLSAMLDGKFIHVPDYANGYAFLALCLTSIVLLILLPKMGPGGALLLCIGLILLLSGINVWAYVQVRVALPLAAQILTVMMAYVLHISYGFFLETRTKRQLASLFGHYVPVALVSEMVKRPAEYTTQAQSRELTIMFCDIHQFTRLAESMEPTQVQALLNRLFNRIAEIIAPNHGTIDKYIGDCVMAFWGAPLPVKDHAWFAVKTACEVSNMLKAFNREQIQAGQPTIQLAIGINTGVVSVGDMGSSIRRSYTVLGDAVNLAARLELLAKAYNVEIVVGERTAELSPQLHWQWLDCIRVAGRSGSANVYAPLNKDAPFAEPDTIQQEEILMWHQFQKVYKHHEWDIGLQLLDKLQILQPNKKLYVLYQERLIAFQQKPPLSDWDGVTDIRK